MTRKRPSGPTLDEILHRHGSLSALARRLGISPSHLSDIRYGRKGASRELAARIQAATGVSADTLTRQEA